MKLKYLVFAAAAGIVTMLMVNKKKHKRVLPQLTGIQK